MFGDGEHLKGTRCQLLLDVYHARIYSILFGFFFVVEDISWSDLLWPVIHI